MARIYALGLMVLCVVCAGLARGAQAQGAPWKERDYNPKPAAEDLILPMPCGGSMVFVPVAVASTGLLDDARIRIGRSENRVGYKEDTRLEFISGTFRVEKPLSLRVFYIGKYEVTKAQNAAINGTCKTPRTPDRVPVTGLSWFDAVDSARHYTEWLYANAPLALPETGNELAFLRLPTELEWEYAARGGMNVDDADFAADLFPMQSGGLAQYAWHQGPGSAAGKLRPVGLLKPNPIGLYDTLGNAGEMVSDFFRLNRRGRLHGQAGGFVIKGGDITLSANQMRTAYRDEVPFYDARTKKAKTQRMLGYRLMISAPVVSSKAQLDKIISEWEHLPAPDVQAERATRERQAFATLASAREVVQDAALKSQLNAALSALEQANTERNDVRDRAVRAILQSGAIIGNKVAADAKLASSIAKALSIAQSAIGRLEELEQQARIQGQGDAADRAATAIAKRRNDLARRQRQLNQVEQDRDNTLSSYLDLVFGVADDYSASIVSPQLEALIAGFQSKEFSYLVKPAEVFAAHVDQYRDKRKYNRKTWLRDLLNE